MNKLVEVEQARAIMTEAIHWSVMKWLSEKKRVRRVADAANLKLDTVEAQLHSEWDKDLHAAYQMLGKNSHSGAPADFPAEVLRVAKHIREAHEAALALRMDAEDTFDRAEKRLSTALAREGCVKAIQGWDHHEEALARAEKAIRNRQKAGTTKA